MKFMEDRKRKKAWRSGLAWDGSAIPKDDPVAKLKHWHDHPETHVGGCICSRCHMRRVEDAGFAGIKIHLQGMERSVLVHESLPEEFCEKTGQRIWTVTGLRSWTHNGEAVAEDVLRTLIMGADMVEMGGENEDR